MSSFYRRREMAEWEYGFWPLVRALSIRRPQRRQASISTICGPPADIRRRRQSTIVDSTGEDAPGHEDMLASVNVTLGRKLVRNWRDHSRPESEPAIGSAVRRHRPTDLSTLCRTTSFSRKQLQHFYRCFKQLCPDGLITAEHFCDMYAQLFPFGGSDNYAKLVFGVLDKTQCGQVPFDDFIHNMATLVNGTDRDRLCWVFSLYDVNNDGFVSEDEMCEVITAIYSMLGEWTDVTEPALARAKQLYKAIDRANDGIVTLAAFLAYCDQNDTICLNLNTFQDMWKT